MLQLHRRLGNFSLTVCIPLLANTRDQPGLRQAFRVWVPAHSSRFSLRFPQYANCENSINLSDLTAGIGCPRWQSRQFLRVGVTSELPLTTDIGRSMQGRLNRHDGFAFLFEHVPASVFKVETFATLKYNYRT